MTKISDFIVHDIDDTIGKGSKAGHYLFKLEYRKVMKNGSMSKLMETKVERKAIHYKRWIIRRCKVIFGVDVSDYFDQNFPILFQFIMHKMKTEIARDLGLL